MAPEHTDSQGILSVKMSSLLLAGRDHGDVCTECRRGFGFRNGEPVGSHAAVSGLGLDWRL